MKYRYEKPIFMARGTHYGNNYWQFESRKLHRRVTAFSNLEYENLLILEMDANVEWYCEQPFETTVFVGDKEYKTVFDVYVLYKNGEEEFQEVKYQEELDSDTPQGERSRNQIVVQKNWCLQNNFNYNLRTNYDIEKGEFYIRNLSVLSAKARRFHVRNKSADNAIIQYLKEISTTTIGYLCSSGRFEFNRTIDYLADLFYRGIIDFNDIQNQCLTNKTEVQYIGK